MTRRETMTSRMFALLVSVAMLSATASVGAGQVGNDPQYRVRIETSNLDALRISLEDAGYDVLGTDAANQTIDVAVSRGELNGLRSRGLSIVSVERGRPLQAATANLTAAAVTGPHRRRRGRPVSTRLPESRRDPRAPERDRVRVSGDRPGRRPHRHLQHAADLRGAAPLRAEDLRQRRRGRGRARDADRDHAPRARDRHAGDRARGRRSADVGLRRRRPDHRGGRRQRDLDRAGVESRRLQPGVHRRQHVAEEPARVRHRRRRRSQPQLRAGLQRVVLGQHERELRGLQGTVGGVRSRDDHDADLVDRRALRQGDRLPLLRP